MDRASPFLNNGGNVPNTNNNPPRSALEIAQANLAEARARRAEEEAEEKQREEARLRGVGGDVNEENIVPQTLPKEQPPLSGKDLRAGEGLDHHEVKVIRDADGTPSWQRIEE
jgi:hypothetical protein